MANVILIAADLPDANIGGRNRLFAWGRRTYSVLGSIVSRWLAGYLARQGGVEVLANHVVAATLVSRPSDVRVQDYTGPLTTAVERLDYTPLHAFADRVAELSAADDAFSHRGISLARIHEIRWIWPLAFAGGFARLVAARADVNGAHRLVAGGISPNMPPACAVAVARGMRLGRATRLLSRLSARLDRFAHDRFLARMSNHYLARDQHRQAWPALGGRLNRPAAPSARRILVVGNFDRTLERFERLWPALRAAGFSAHVIALPRAKWITRLREQGVDCSTIPDWLSARDLPHLEASAAALGGHFWQILSKDATLRDLRVDGVSILELATPSLRSHVLSGAYGAMLAAEIAVRALDALSPDLVVGFEDWDFNRSFNLAARQRGIPTVGYYCLSAPAVAGLVRRTHDVLAVSGEQLQRAFSTQYRADCIHIVGDPLAVPAIASDRSAARNRVVKELGLKADGPIVLVLMTYPFSGMSLANIETYVRRSFEVVQGLPNAQMVIKAHPAQSVDDIRRWLANWDCPAVPIVKDAALFDLCAAADLVSTPITTAVHQAMMASVPVISLQDADALEAFEAMGYEFLAGKGVVHIPPGVDPVPLCRDLIQPGPAREAQVARGYRHVEEHVGPRDGLAPQRFATLAQELVAIRLGKTP